MYFQKFYMMATKSLALSNLSKEDMKDFMEKFAVITLLMDAAKYDEARKKMGDYLMEIQSKRPVKEFGIHVY